MGSKKFNQFLENPGVLKWYLNLQEKQYLKKHVIFV